MDKLQISEIFYSIQGEGLFTGKPCVFIRLAGCNERCKWCDTQFAWGKSSGFELANIEIIQKIKTFNCSLVLITGGEPLLQAEVIELMQQLLDANYNVLLETNGSILIDKLPAKVHIALDIKCPSSAMTLHNNFDNIALLKFTDVVKFIIADNNDYDWAIERIQKYRIYEFCHNIIFSPAFPHMSLDKLADYLLALSQRSDLYEIIAKLLPTVRLQTQLHKIIWHPTERAR